MVLALSKLERDVAAGHVITEVDVDERTTGERARQEKFVGTCIFRGEASTVKVMACLDTAVVHAFQCPQSIKHALLTP